ncbi:MAG: carboxypeptidase M32 [Gemmatimonadetes bacterium]|nr:carboxypeptidase M32 [Gemmatimonadota bacterium]
MSEPYRELAGLLAEAARLASVSSLLSWDQETGMPAGGAQLRAEQLALLAGLVHERRTAPRLAELLAACEADAEMGTDPVVGANLREIRRDYDRAVRLPSALVRQLAETASLAMEAWRDARERSDYAAFAPWLERTLELVRAKAECLRKAAGDDLYDGLLDEYEPGATAREVETIFAQLRLPLTELVAEVTQGPRQHHRVRGLRVPIAGQKALSAWLVQRIGFNLADGRLDVSTHPFCQGIGPGDTRLTSRYREDALLDGLGSVLHEAGHGLYEQGLPKREFWGQPRADAAGLGMHESQSRLWENMVGRSRPFWSWLVPEARRFLGSALDGITVDDLHRAANAVEPGSIRVEADEASYNLHILLRFDLERAMLAGDLDTRDLPGEWNRRMEQDTGVQVRNDAQGCLQDIHWSFGAIGYFPTYTLGNVYAAQFWTAAQRDMPDLADQFARGEFGPLLGWLREKIHRHGRRWTGPELCRQVTGAAPGPAPLLEYLNRKLRPLHVT